MKRFALCVAVLLPIIAGMALFCQAMKDALKPRNEISAVTIDSNGAKSAEFKVVLNISDPLLVEQR